MNLPAPKGWTVYGGADGFDSIPDANGYLWWADNMWLTGKDRNDTWQFIVCRYKNGVSEVMPLPERCNGAGRLNWTPVGLYVSVSHGEPTGAVTPKSFIMPQYAQFVQGAPVVIQLTNSAITAVDQQARADASQALQEAHKATEIARNTITAETVTAAISARIMSFLDALKTGNRADSVNALWMDVLFAKTNDWIYGWMRDHKKL